MNRGRQNLLWILPLVLLIASFVRPRFSLGSERLDDLVDAAGFALVLIGVGLRVCARGWKYENARRQGLVMDGLYGYVRHPLYAASFLIGVGVCVILGVPTFALAYLAFFWASHLRVIRHEEAKLARRFSETFAEYRQRVPAMIPGLDRLRSRAPIRPRALLASIRREADCVCGWTIASIGLMIWQDLAAPGAAPSIGMETAVLIGVAGLLAVAWIGLRAGMTGDAKPAAG